MEVPAKLVEFLNQSKVRYQLIHHPEAFTAQELAAIEHVKGKNHAKVVMVKADGEKFMAVLPLFPSAWLLSAIEIPATPAAWRSTAPVQIELPLLAR